MKTKHLFTVCLLTCLLGLNSIVSAKESNEEIVQSDRLSCILTLAKIAWATNSDGKKIRYNSGVFFTKKIEHGGNDTELVNMGEVSENMSFLGQLSTNKENRNEIYARVVIVDENKNEVLDVGKLQGLGLVSGYATNNDIEMYLMCKALK